MKNQKHRKNQFFNKIGFLYIPIQVYYYETEQNVSKKKVISDHKNFSIEEIEEYNLNHDDYNTITKKERQKIGKNKGKVENITFIFFLNLQNFLLNM